MPDDVAVLGIDNVAETCQACKPSLSSVDIAAERIGEEAIRTVVAMIEGKEVPAVTTIPPVDLIPRESTNTRAHLDSNVQKVLGFMHHNMDQLLEKDDFVRMQTLGRRALEKHFKISLGEGPMQHLRSLRLQKARSLVETTDLTVVDIGRQCGIPDANYLSRLFRNRFGMSPLQHRKRHSTMR
jgi:transcriptional regulator GlxA family with amidase domain